VPLYAVLLAALLIWLDVGTRFYIQFPITFMLPVSLAAWFCGRRWGVGLGILLSLIRAFYVAALWSTLQSAAEIAINAAIRIAVFVTFALLLDTVAQRDRVLEAEAIALKQLLAICAWCKKVRTEDQDWTSIESYLLEHNSQEVTSGICPECRETEFQ